MAENSNRAVVLRGGYRQIHPPDDDCCPICFGTFKVPCRTSCGHWYCGSCFLRLWRYTKDIKPCKCPMCGRKVTSVVPYKTDSGPLGREARKVIKGINEYNFVNIDIWIIGIFLKALVVPSLTRRRLRRSLDFDIMAPLYRVMRRIMLYMVILYNVCGFKFLPLGSNTILICMEIIIAIWVVILYAEALWNRWNNRRQ